jgi:hypothetical protein
MPKGSYDPEGYWSGFEVTPIVVAFQTKLLKAPTSRTAIKIFSSQNIKAR